MSGKKSNSFSYVNITSRNCEGWLNLFFGEHCLACISDPVLAEEIRESIDRNMDGKCVDKSVGLVDRFEKVSAEVPLSGVEFDGILSQAGIDSEAAYARLLSRMEEAFAVSGVVRSKQAGCEHLHRNKPLSRWERAVCCYYDLVRCECGLGWRVRTWEEFQLNKHIQRGWVDDVFRFALHRGIWVFKQKLWKCKHTVMPKRRCIWIKL